MNMFDTTMIGKRIKQARIDKNMTQMALADAMGVSYQAVSNWERGNSMPDISKLGDLCAALDLTVNALLGLEESAPNAVKKAMDQEELTLEELAEVAPMMLPEDVKMRMEGNCLHIDIGGGSVDVKLRDESDAEPEKEVTAGEADKKHGPRIVRVFTKKEKEQNKEAEVEKTKRPDLSQIADLAPFLDQEYLDQMVRDADLTDLDGIEEVAPFLKRETLDYLVEQAGTDDLETLSEIAPFLSRETLDKLVKRCTVAEEFSTLEELAPFVSRETLDRLAETVEPDSIWEVVSIAPFFSREALDKLVSRCEDEDKMDAIEELAPFLSDTTLSTLVDHCIEKGKTENLENIYPFLSRGTLRKLANHMMEQKNLDSLEDIMPFV